MDNGFTERFQVLHEIIAAARHNLNANMWDYVTGGTATETTVRRNRLALDRVGFRPHVLQDVSGIDTTARFLGHTIRMPLALAPVGGLEQIAPGGSISVARGAGMAGVPFFLSSVMDDGPEPAAEAATGPKVFQLYVRGDAAWVDDYVRRAVDSGYDAFCITVDSAIYSRRERDIAKRFNKPWRAAAGSSPPPAAHPAPNRGAMDWQAALSWDDIARFKDRHRIKLILKGIATAEDAARACELGVEGIYVSNHGGRQLDHGAGTIDLLTEVLDAIAGRAFTIVDGGISRGSDIVKMIAMGADLVGMGRLYCYGLAAAGDEGIVRIVELLEIEVAETLGLLGLNSFEGLNRSHIRPVEVVTSPHVLSAFPLLTLPEQRY